MQADVYICPCFFIKSKMNLNSFVISRIKPPQETLPGGGRSLVPDHIAPMINWAHKPLRGGSYSGGKGVELKRQDSQFTGTFLPLTMGFHASVFLGELNVKEPHIQVEQCSVLGFCFLFLLVVEHKNTCLLSR